MHPLVWLFRDQSGGLLSRSKGATTRLEPLFRSEPGHALENRLGFRLGLNLHDPIRGHWSSPGKFPGTVVAYRALHYPIYTFGNRFFADTKSTTPPHSNFRQTRVYTSGIQIIHVFDDLSKIRWMAEITFERSSRRWFRFETRRWCKKKKKEKAIACLSQGDTWQRTALIVARITMKTREEEEEEEKGNTHSIL